MPEKFYISHVLPVLSNVRLAPNQQWIVSLGENINAVNNTLIKSFNTPILVSTAEILVTEMDKYLTSIRNPNADPNSVNPSSTADIIKNLGWKLPPEEPQEKTDEQAGEKDFLSSLKLLSDQYVKYPLHRKQLKNIISNLEKKYVSQSKQPNA